MPLQSLEHGLYPFRRITSIQPTDIQISQGVSAAKPQRNYSNNSITATTTSWAQVVSGPPATTQLPQSNANSCRPKRNIFIGTGDTTENETFIGRDDKNKKVWLFISRIPDTIDDTIVRNYIKKKTNITNEDDLVVKHIPTKLEQLRPNSKGFQVGIRYDLLDKVYQQDFWPRNVAFERYKFRRQPRQDDRTSEETENDFLGN